MLSEKSRKTVDILRKIDVESYGMASEEQIAAGAVKAYLCGRPEQEALALLLTAMKGTVLRIPALHQKPELLRTVIKGPELIQLIDTAVEKQTEILKKSVGEYAAGGGIRKTAIQALSRIHGQQIVDNATPEFLCFLMDCYETLRNLKNITEC